MLNKTVLNPKYHYLEKILQDVPSLMEDTEQGTVIYRGRNLVKVFQVEGIQISVKSFKKPIFINQIAYSYFRKSKAERSYQYGIELQKEGFLTPDPIAYIEQKSFSLLKHSYYISIYENFDGLLRELRHGSLEQHRELIRQFAIYSASLHSANIFHSDYSPGNILYKLDKGIYRFYLVDLNRMIFNKKIDMETACHNFERFWGNKEMMTYLLEEYAKARNFDVGKCKELGLTYFYSFWQNRMKSHPNEYPYA